MNTQISESSILPENQTAANIWNAGGEAYDRISQQIADAIEHCVDRLNPQKGENILDIATGTGWTARRTQRRGANVTGIDLGVDSIDAARRLDSSGEIDFQVADAENLPFEDNTFDGVISTFGIMFCGNSKRAASELVRVCKPSGRMSLAIWDNHGGIFDMFQVISKHKPASASPAPSPFEWANRANLNEWFGNSMQIGTEKGTSYYREASSADAWKAFSTCYGPLKCLAEKLDHNARMKLRSDFEAFHSQYKSELGILVPRPYLIAMATMN